MLALIASVSLLLSAVGCASGSSSTKKQDRSRTSKSTDERPPPETPTPEELQGSPCGNPDWARLPDRQQESDDDATEDEADEKPESEEAPAESSQNAGENRRDADSYACRPTE